MIRDDVKLALRIKTTVFDTELDMLIEACRADLRASGVRMPDVMAGANIGDPRVTRAITLYCKSHWGYEDNATAERFLRAYDCSRLELVIHGGAY